jgi:putative heme-binding domain-containing protein
MRKVFARSRRAGVVIHGLCILLACMAAQASPPVAPTEPLSPEEERAKFRIPAGFEIQLVASEPQIQKPMNMAFDAKGRLWVTHSVEYPFAVTDGSNPRDGLTILEDFAADGRARKATLFADALNIPIGVLPLPSGNEAIVWSIPNILKLTDSDGDGKADRREVLYGPFDFTDTHGDQNSFRLGPDGWVYACHGFHNDSKVKLRGEGEVVLTMQSGNTYRFKPDGSAIEQVTWGQVNPFGMCFDSLGNQFNADCHSKPLTMLLRGGHYESFGKQHGGLGYAPSMTGHNHGSTGIAGAAVYEADDFPPECRGSMFVGNVVTNVVHRDVLQWKGSSPWVDTPEDFVACDDWWFRPVDLQIGPDGGLYIADFYNCIIGHYEVDLLHPRRDRTRGRVWRVVAQGDGGSPPPGDLTRSSFAELLGHLGHANQTVRRLAGEQIVERFGGDEAALGELTRLITAERPSGLPADLPAGGERTDSGSMRAALAVRTVARLGRLATDTAAKAAADPAPIVRVHLIKAIDAMPGWDSSRGALVRGALLDASPFVRRAAAEAAAAHPEPESIVPLLRCLAATPQEDTHLVQALRLALFENLKRAPSADLPTAELSPAEWLALLDVAVAVPSDAVAWLAFTHACDHEVAEALLSQSCASVVRNCGPDRIGEAVREARTACGDDLVRQSVMLQVVADAAAAARKPIAGIGELKKWAEAFATAALTQRETTLPPAAQTLAFRMAEQLRLVQLADDAMRLVADRAAAEPVRIAAAAAAVQLDRPRAIQHLAAIVAALDEPLPLREAAARQLGLDGSPEAREPLVKTLATAPAGLQAKIAISLSHKREGADVLLGLVAAGKASPRLLQDQWVLMTLRNAGISDLETRLSELTRGLPAADMELKLTTERVKAAYVKDAGSKEKGAAIFRGSCGTCHRHGGSGGMIGPQLDGVGQRGIDRLLEDILDPNRNVDEAFRTTTVLMADGRAISGLKLREEAGDLVLADSTGKEFRIPQAEIEETVSGHLSPMPANMAEQVGEQNLPHLLAYLLGK